MKIFDFINACALEWEVIRIFTDGEKGPKDLGSFFKFNEIPESLLETEIDSWTVYEYSDGTRKTCEIDIYI